jgi:hypothetical protein
MEEVGFSSLAADEMAFELSGGQLRLSAGSIAMYIEASTYHHPYLSALCPTNAFWMHPSRIEAPGIAIRDAVGATAAVGQFRIKAKVKDAIYSLEKGGKRRWISTPSTKSWRNSRRSVEI